VKKGPGRKREIRPSVLSLQSVKGGPSSPVSY